MFGLEIWFVLAIASAISGGLFIFTTKVAAERDYDVVLLSTSAITLSGVIFLVITVLKNDYSGMSEFVYLMIVINSFGYMGVNILRHIALQCVDTAVYYPIYKALTPAIAIIAGVALFHERFTGLEWAGLGLSLAVPLLLITHAEKGRQKDLFRGLKLLLITALLASVAAAVVKAGTNATDNIWLFITLTDFGIVFIGIFVLISRNGKRPLKDRFKSFKNTQFLLLTFWMGALSAASFSTIVFAFSQGPLGIVYTVQSLYILIPIILSIIFYNEHWNLRKVIAIILSVGALALLK